LTLWVVMMIAMMFPSVAPMAIVWSNGIARTASGATRVARMSSFIAGYLLAWTAYGVLAFAAVVAIARASDMHPQDAHWISAGLFAFAGAYQLTPLKRACLRHCRTPFVALMHYAAWSPRARDLRVGLHHGAYCVGCCWGLMAILIAVGVMNVPAMLLVTAIVFFEKVWRYGEVLAKGLGVVFIGLALLQLR
jgi:predicted metal-binding membrane protein